MTVEIDQPNPDQATDAELGLAVAQLLQSLAAESQARVQGIAGLEASVESLASGLSDERTSREAGDLVSRNRAAALALILGG